MNFTTPASHPFNFVKIVSVVFIVVLLNHPCQAFSSIANMSVVKNNSWISERDNLNISLSLKPQVPVIDQVTRLSFEVRNLNESMLIDNLNTKVTLTDHDGRLYKFENKFIPIYGGHFSVDYIFPDDGEHRIILQLYKNTTPFTVSSFDLVIPHPTSPSQNERLLNLFTDFFNSLL